MGESEKQPSAQWQHRDQHGYFVEMSPEARRLAASRGSREHAGLVQTRTDPVKIPEPPAKGSPLTLTRRSAGDYVTTDGKYGLTSVSGMWRLTLVDLGMRLPGSLDYPSYEEARSALAAFLQEGPSGLRRVNQTVAREAILASVRHVRTPEGERRYGQPIGSVITRDRAVKARIPAMSAEYERPWLSTEEAVKEIRNTIIPLVKAHFPGFDFTIRGENFDSQVNLYFDGTAPGKPNLRVHIQRDVSPFRGTVHNAYFTVNAAYQGSGLATVITENLEALYRKRGINTVDVGANIDVGGYAWAKKGFDFADPGDALYFLKSMRTADPDLLFQIDKLIERAESGGRVTPIEIAMIGYEKRTLRPAPRDPSQQDEIWLGKAFMLGRSWSGVKRLYPEGEDPRIQQMTDEQWANLLKYEQGINPDVYDMPAVVEELKKEPSWDEVESRLHRVLREHVKKTPKATVEQDQIEPGRGDNAYDPRGRFWQTTLWPVLSGNTHGSLITSIVDQILVSLGEDVSIADLRTSAFRVGSNTWSLNVTVHGDRPAETPTHGNASITVMPTENNTAAVHVRLAGTLANPWSTTAYGVSATQAGIIEGLTNWLSDVEPTLDSVRVTLQMPEDAKAHVWEAIQSSSFYETSFTADGIIIQFRPPTDSSLGQGESMYRGFRMVEEDGRIHIYPPPDVEGRDDWWAPSRENAQQMIDLLALLAPVTAGGDSWRWQLRDKNGKWIEMGTEVRWLAKGLYKHGIVIGSPSPGIAKVREILTDLVHNIPSSRLEVVKSAAEVLGRVYEASIEKGYSKDLWEEVDLKPHPALRQFTEKARIEGADLTGWGGLLPAEMQDILQRINQMAPIYMATTPYSGMPLREDFAHDIVEDMILLPLRGIGVSDEDISTLAGAIAIRALETPARDEIWLKTDAALHAKTKELVDLVRGENAQINIAAPADAAEQILWDDRFRSQFDTGDSQGYLDPVLRAEFEMSLFGLHPDVETDLRTIYGFVSSLGNEDAFGVRQYGGVRFVLKPEVRARTTVTIGDSLGTGAIPVPMDGEITERQAWDAVANGPERIIIERSSAPDVAALQVELTAYHEAQIHGGVTLADIDHITIMDPGEQDPGTLANVEARARELGIPVWYSDTVSTARRVASMTRGELW